MRGMAACIRPPPAHLGHAAGYRGCVGLTGSDLVGQQPHGPRPHRWMRVGQPTRQQLRIGSSHGMGSPQAAKPPRGIGMGFSELTQLRGRPRHVLPGDSTTDCRDSKCRKYCNS